MSTRIAPPGAVHDLEPTPPESGDILDGESADAVDVRPNRAVIPEPYHSQPIEKRSHMIRSIMSPEFSTGRLRNKWVIVSTRTSIRRAFLDVRDPYVTAATSSTAAVPCTTGAHTYHFFFPSASYANKHDPLESRYPSHQPSRRGYSPHNIQSCLYKCQRRERRLRTHKKEKEREGQMEPEVEWLGKQQDTKKGQRRQAKPLKVEEMVLQEFAYAQM
jgi:hypothetical protein